MVKGRKPDANAVRRRKPPKDAGTVELVAEIVEQSDPIIQKPPAVASNVTMSECWDLVVGDGIQFTPADVPQLEQLCYWYAVFRQCVANTVMPDGRIVTKVGSDGEDGEIDQATLRSHPDLRSAKEASAMYRQLASELGVDPLARQRMGLLDAVTKSTQADLVRKTEELFARFQKKGLPNA